MTFHDALMLAAWPVATALLNLLVVWAGHSDKPYAKLLAKLGTVLLEKALTKK